MVMHWWRKQELYMHAMRVKVVLFFFFFFFLDDVWQIIWWIWKLKQIQSELLLLSESQAGGPRWKSNPSASLSLASKRSPPSPSSILMLAKKLGVVIVVELMLGSLSSLSELCQLDVDSRLDFLSPGRRELSRNGISSSLDSQSDSWKVAAVRGCCEVLDVFFFFLDSLISFWPPACLPALRWGNSEVFSHK